MPEAVRGCDAARREKTSREPTDGGDGGSREEGPVAENKRVPAKAERELTENKRGSDDDEVRSSLSSPSSSA